MKKKIMPSKQTQLETKIKIDTNQKVMILAVAIAGVIFVAGLLAGVITLPTQTSTPSSKFSSGGITCTAAIAPAFTKKVDSETLNDTMSQLEGDTADLLNVVKSKRAITTETLASRKQLLVEVMHGNPEYALNSLILDDATKSYFNETTNCIEVITTVQGTVEARIADFEDGTSITEYTLRLTDGSKKVLHPTDDYYFSSISGSEIKVTGYEVDNHIIFDSSNTLAAAESFDDGETGFDIVQTASQELLAGPQETLLLLVYFLDTPMPSFTISQSQDRMTEVHNYYSENSYGAISLTGVLDAGENADVRGWFQLPRNHNCTDNNIVNEAIAAAFPTGIDFTAYQRLAVVAPFPECIGSHGWSTDGKVDHILPDNTVHVMSSSLTWYIEFSQGMETLGHEYGHGFGLRHAGFMYCDDVPLKLDESDCYTHVYADWYDIMGFQNKKQLNAPHKEFLGWIDGRVQNVSVNGDYILAPLESNSDLATIKVPRTANEYLYFEFRQPIGLDIGLGNVSSYEGALVYASPSPGSTTRMIDATIGSMPIALAVGQSITDPYTGSVIETILLEEDSVNPENSRLTMRVTLGNTDFIPPAVTIDSPSEGENISGMLTATATATDPSGISLVEFYFNNETTPYGTDTTVPFEAPSFDTTVLPNGQNKIRVIAYDAAGDPWGVPNNSATTENNFMISNTDAIPPTVNLNIPSDGASVFDCVEFEATAADNAGIHRVEFMALISELPEVVATVTTSPYADCYNFFSEGVGDYEVWARAYDLVGNSTDSDHHTISFDMNYHDNWPTTTFDDVKSSPLVVDIDPSVPGLEVIVGSDDGAIYAYQENGSLLWQYDTCSDAISDPCNSIRSSPAVADLNPLHDGLEIVVGSGDGNIYVLYADGSYYWHRRVGDGSSIQSSPAISDLDNNGILDIVIGSTNNEVYAWEADGDAKWEFITDDSIYSTPSIADIDSSVAGLETAVGTYGGSVYVLNKDGGILSEAWPRVVSDTPFAVDAIRSTPAIADLDPDYAGLEIAVGSLNGNFYAWHADGTPILGDPFGLFATTGDYIGSSPIIVDLDTSTAGLEVIVGSHDGNIYAWHNDGSPVTGWPQFHNNWIVGSLVAVDLDGDNSLEVITGTGAAQLYAWHADGSRVASWPKRTGGGIWSSPAVADLDGDGTLEIIVGSDDNKLYAWEAVGTSSVRTPWPMFGHNPTRRGTPDAACLDGTVYFSCVPDDKPNYCQTGSQINNCGACGCDSGLDCRADGSCGVDNIPPTTFNHNPSPGSTASIFTNISVDIMDDGSGVDISSIAMTVEGSLVSPFINGNTIQYNPPTNFTNGQTVNVTVDASDLAGNVMPTDSYSFTAICTETCGSRECGTVCGVSCGTCDPGFSCSTAGSCYLYMPSPGGCIWCDTCFLGDTNVLMEDGSTKLISEMKIGDKVVAYDDVTAQFKTSTVTEVFDHEVDYYWIVNDYLQVTPNHSVYTPSGWQLIGELGVGNNLLTKRGDFEEIWSIEEVNDDVTVYNFTAEPYPTYIADGVVAHNRGRGKPGTTD